MLTDDELRANTHAGSAWSDRRDLPDPVGWADIVFADDLTLAVIRERLADGFRPARAHRLPLPKGNGEDLRYLTVADPFDEVIYRTIVARLADRIDDALGPEVRSYRLTEPGPGWTVLDLGYTNRERRRDASARLLAPDFGGLGMLDVRQYYPSVHLEHLAEILISLGASARDVTALAQWLTAWQQVWHVVGVPVGPEASGLLGNVYLIPADHELRKLQVPFQRYTDDYRLFLPGPEIFAAARDAVAAAASQLGLGLNTSKTRHIETQAIAHRYLGDTELDRLDTLWSIDRRVALQAARDLFDREIAIKSPDAKRVKYCLRVFRNHHDPHGAIAAQATETVMRIDPKTWGDYLGRLHGARKLDRDWIAETALGELTPGMAAVRIHALRACATGHNARSYGERFRDVATESSGKYIPVRCAAAEAWAHSDRWKPTLAADAALAAGDAQQRRALTLTLRHAPPGQKRREALAKLGSSAPECRPAARWIEEARDRAA